MILARRYLVSGRVQGVGFRFFARDIAQREGLRGYVRNRPDGCVEALATGEATALDRFERAIRVGPSPAGVDRVAVQDWPVDLSQTGFEITP